VCMLLRTKLFCPWFFCDAVNGFGIVRSNACRTRNVAWQIYRQTERKASTYHAAGRFQHCTRAAFFERSRRQPDVDAIKNATESSWALILPAANAALPQLVASPKWASLSSVELAR